MSEEEVSWPEEFGEEPPLQAQFKKDMQAAGYTITPYWGRYFYKGWAAEVPSKDLQKAIRATSVEVVWDNLAFDWIVYPQQGV